MADRKPTRPLNLAIAFAAAVFIALPLFAIQPAQWLHTTEADFAEGANDNTVVTNLGDIQLAKAAAIIGEMPEDVSIIYDIQQANGKTYLAAGPNATLLLQNGESIEQLLTVDASQIFALDTYGDKLLVAISAAQSKLAVLNDDNTLTDLITFEEVRYIWDMAVLDNMIYVATGIDGKVLSVDFSVVDENGQPVVSQVLDTSQSNILCLATDNQNRIYAGTDTDGLVYRITPNPDAAPDIFVLYDAAEPEIGALYVQPNGVVFAGTADAEQARPGRLEEAAKAEVGRPEQPETEKSADVPEITPTPEPLDDAPEEKQSQTHSQSTPMHAVESTPESEQVVAVDAVPAEPTAEQRDQLRDVIRKRLEKARKTGQLQAGGAASAPPGRSSGPRPSRRPTAAAQPDQEGNAIYRIDTTGFVSEVFRESVMILKITPDSQGKLLVATGNEGQIFRVDPVAEETTILADLESQQIPAILATADQLLIATANPASLTRLDPGFASNGVYTSNVLDASQISLWGVLKLIATTPTDTAIVVETRSGNVQDPEMAAWSPWQVAATLQADDESQPLAPRIGTIASPPARFLQYRLKLNSGNDATPTVDRVQLAYVVPNLKPVVTSITASYGDEQQTPQQPQPGSDDEQPQPLQALMLEWEAADANMDPLIHTLEYQPAGTDTWLTIAEDIVEVSYEWQTQRVPDGRYIIRVTTSDSPANTPDMAKSVSRRSDPVVIDNTPPVFDEVRISTTNGNTTVQIIAKDDLLPIKAVHYAIDSTEMWQPTIPNDMIYDSTTESISITIPDLSPGPHVMTLRVTDRQGNARYQSQVIKIP